MDGSKHIDMKIGILIVLVFYTFQSQAQLFEANIYHIEIDPNSPSFKAVSQKKGEIIQLNDTTFQIISFERGLCKFDTLIKYSSEMFDYKHEFKNDRLFFYFSNASVKYFAFEQFDKGREFSESIKPISKATNKTKNTNFYEAWLIGESIFISLQLLFAVLSN